MVSYTRMVQEYVYVEECDVGDGRVGGGEGQASEPAQSDTAESAERQTPMKDRKSLTPAK